MADQTGAWTFPIQWSRAFGEEFRFRTEIITSRRGDEQRIAQRQKPRMAYDFESFLNFDDFREAMLRLSKNQGREMTIPHPRWVTTTTSDVTGATFTIQSAQDWIRVGDGLILDDGLNREAVIVDQVDGNTLTISSDTENVFATGTKVYRGVKGYFNAESEIRAATSRVGLSRVEFDADPVDTWHDDFSIIPESYNGKELFNFGHQWAGDLTVEFMQPIIDLDLQRGDVDRLYPTPFTNRKYRLRFVIRNEDQYDRLVGLFNRCRGRQKSFYMPLHLDEIRPLVIVPGDAFTVPGEDFFRQYGDLSMYRSLRFDTTEFTFTTGVSQVQLDINGDSVVTIADVFPAGVPASGIKSIKWVGLCRFEADTLALEWITDRVAEATVQIRTLEDSA